MRPVTLPRPAGAPPAAATEPAGRSTVAAGEAPCPPARAGAARAQCVELMAAVMQNCLRFMIEDFDVHLVANDSFDLHEAISERAGMKVVQRFVRPVLNRSERDRCAYCETIFHVRGRRQG